MFNSFFNICGGIEIYHKLKTVKFVRCALKRAISKNMLTKIKYRVCYKIKRNRVSEEGLNVKK